ncbi:unnamed protein product [Kuraishia capsulata CBS 1993]|uniref:Uncharacterized protein n=1 Tax=Kuraishia capsulata CBS 1993 TaxID=1382522 RepID=W6MQ48_9ASCO|nr:uncharacterized protein KUCA_T00004441001 [Kuraishia capsulata CBS 1993]CDK28458.1 unnamed protein product [Kuraishia capsulata CBS 1993]
MINMFVVDGEPVLLIPVSMVVTFGERFPLESRTRTLKSRRERSSSRKGWSLEFSRGQRMLLAKEIQKLDKLKGSTERLHEEIKINFVEYFRNRNLVPISGKFNANNITQELNLLERSPRCCQVLVQMQESASRILVRIKMTFYRIDDRMKSRTHLKAVVMRVFEDKNYIFSSFKTGLVLEKMEITTVG